MEYNVVFSISLEATGTLNSKHTACPPAHTKTHIMFYFHTEHKYIHPCIRSPVRNSKVSPDLFLPENGIVKGTVA
jgi:hypothetical protein